MVCMLCGSAFHAQRGDKRDPALEPKRPDVRTTFEQGLDVIRVWL